MGIKVTIAAIVLFIYSLFATYQWWSNNEVAEIECDKSALETEIAQLKATGKELEEKLAQANKLQEKQKPEGDRVRTEIRTVFVPLKEKVRVIEVAAGSCPGRFDDGVRDSFTKAVAAANQS